MAVISTKPFLIVGILKNRKEILEKIQNLKCVQVEEIKYLKNAKVEQTLEEIEKEKLTTEKAILTVYSKLNNIKNLKEKKTTSTKILKNVVENKEKIYCFAKNIIRLQKELTDLEKEVNFCENEKLELLNYVTINVPTNFVRTKNTKFLVGELEGSFREEELCLKLKDVENNIYFKIVKTTKNSTIFFLIANNEAFEKTKEIVLNLGFNEIKTKSNKTPKEEILKLEEKIKTLKDKILKIEEKIKNNEQNLNDMKVLEDYLNIRKEKYEIIKKTYKTNNTFILKGFLNPKFEQKLKKLIVKDFSSHIEVFNEEENSPVFFSNNFFASGVENITKTYSMPSKKDIDPNPIMAFFYYLFFGMMFSDAGYGLILTIFCLFSLLTKKNTENKNTFRMMFLCGIFTTFWGFMYGSFFGDLTYSFSKKFLKNPFSLPPIWINTTKNPLLLLIVSIMLGILQIVVGLLIKFNILIKNKNFKEAFFETLNWIIILTSIAAFLANSILKTVLLTTIAKFLFIIGVLITVFLSGHKQKGVLKFVFGIVNLYGITSYISDVLSYSRLMALGIATGVIADVVNILASMGNNNFSGFLIFSIIFFVGHAINFSINILGAYVHTNRLQYVEFFSKFYVGGGKMFKPFSFKTKYFEFI